MSEGFIRCPECKRALPANTEVCTNCDHKLNAPEVDPNSTKTCRYCGEEILAVAVKCKHCGSSLTETAVRNGGSEPSVGSGSVARRPKGLIAAVIASLILAFTNPSQPDFNKFVLESMAESTGEQASTGFDRFLSGVAVMAISNVTERRDFILFSLYDIDTSMIRAFNPDAANRKFVGLLGQFIPLSTSICDYIDTTGTNCNKKNEIGSVDKPAVHTMSDPVDRVNLTCADVKYGQESYGKNMNALQIAANGYPKWNCEDTPCFGRYDESAVSDLCAGNFSGVDDLVKNGFVDKTAIKNIASILKIKYVMKD